ncbi:LAQU0S01e02454g1_1 [Lachancea quebecensis]|uniref:LAQU0S01e02454g1_1 n=1 Tax=Lachancea quebecensis TaxID=1654605 RepID=A0A0P1KUR1_9SACH|nr:LAQU0S01e02454g1_1 [Lachancea quebecensis]
MLEFDKKLCEKVAKLPVEELRALEREFVFARFDFEVAFDLGCRVRQWARELFPADALVVDVSLPSGQCVFHATSNAGTALDNDMWVARKRRTAVRFGCSSFVMGRKLADKQRQQRPSLTMQEAYFVDPAEYAFHGGALPLRVDAVDAPVAVLTVSGLAQATDHAFALACAREFASRLAQRELDLD